MPIIYREERFYKLTRRIHQVIDHKRHNEVPKVTCIGKVTARYVKSSPHGEAVMKSTNDIL